jgi:hypothetical protein
MPADAGLRRVIAFQNRPGIDITFLLPAERVKKLVDFIELVCNQVVIVIAPRISRDSACSGWRFACLGLSLEIIQRQNNDRARARQYLLRITAFFFLARHVTHFTVPAFIQPISKFVCVWGGTAVCDAAGVKTNLARK